MLVFFLGRNYFNNDSNIISIKMKNKVFAIVIGCIFFLTSFSTVSAIKKESIVIDDYNLQHSLLSQNRPLSLVSLLKARRNRIRPHLFGIDVQNSNVVTVVGEASVILCTTDGGKTWKEQRAWTWHPCEMLMDVSFYDENIGLAVGIDNSIVYTKNGGHRWYTAQHPGPFQPWIGFFGAQMVTPEVGFAAGVGTYFFPLVARTDNCWRSWEYTYPILKNGTTPYTASLKDIYFFNSSTGVVCAVNWLYNQVLSGIIRTPDGGTTWETVYFEEGHGYESIDFPSSQVGFSLGIGWYNNTHFSNTIIKTSDSGETWNTVNDSLLVGDKDSYAPLYDISFPTENIGVAVGQNGVIVKTMDAGETWKKQESGTTNTLHAVEFVDQNIGFAIGEHGTILHTQDGGDNWSFQNKNIHWKIITILRTLISRIIS